MVEFCEACHGDTAPGASTNVVSGVFDSGPSGANGIAIGGASGSAPASATGYPADGGSQVVKYQTASTFNAPLNGGGFSRMPDPYQWEKNASVSYAAATSAHNMNGSQVLWGAGSAATTSYNLDCTSCHDPHGTSNYRLLKASVNGVTVGGYQADGETPNAFIFSNEQGYPLPGTDPNNMVGGWLKHQAGADQMAAYRPNYTETTDTPIVHTDATGNKSMSVWCSACHTEYDQRTSAYNYQQYEPNGGDTTAPNYVNGSTTGAGGTALERHRHPVDVTLANGVGPNKTLTESVVSGKTTNMDWIPLEHNANTAETTLDKQWIGCLTCHRAHGSSVQMTGYAAAHLAKNAAGIWAPVQDGIQGVDPVKGTSSTSGGSTLLRADNRGVCERCHAK
jgi:predicted CXXCH cytochrome family protein